MGLLVAGITGGASLIDNARLTSLKREVDERTNDLFIFYTMRGRFPGDLDDTRRIGTYWGQSCPMSNFSDPYYHASKSINQASCPFVELYLAGISSFKPDPTKNGITNTVSETNIKTNVADQGGIPFSKAYREFMYSYRYEGSAESIPSNVYTYGMNHQMGVDLVTTESITVASKKIMEIVKKIESKFDDGIYNSGDIRSACNGVNNVSYISANVCHVVVFFNSSFRTL
jgi:hypothetical protein